MPDEEGLIKTSFIDKLAREKTERQREIVEAREKKKKDRRDLLCLASLERFLKKKLDFKGNMSDLRELDEREITNIKKFVLSDARKKSFWSGLGFSVFSFLHYLTLPSLILPPAVSLIVSLLIGLFLGATLLSIFLHNVWLVMTRHYLNFYCQECIQKRNTSLSCYCENGD